jgi:hypothetical protein
MLVIKPGVLELQIETASKRLQMEALNRLFRESIIRLAAFQQEQLDVQIEVVLKLKSWSVNAAASSVVAQGVEAGEHSYCCP